MCLKDTNEMGCAEIYGHVEWVQTCWCGICEIQGGKSGKGGPMKLYFSVPAFVVLFRESLEVMIVLVILIQFLEKAHEEGSITKEMFKAFKREVYLGATIGFAGCIVFGVGVLCLASLVYQAFEGDNRRLFEGCMMFITCFVLTYLALSFYKMINSKEGHERKMRQMIQESLEAAQEARTTGNAAFSKKYTFFVLALTTGFREGMESIVFLIGVVSDVSDLSSLPIPIITALISSRLVGFCFMKGTNKMRVERFMKCSSLLLLFIAAGFFMGAVHKIQELGDQVFGDNTKKDGNPMAWQNEPVWDWSDTANDKTDRFFVLMRALLGYQDKPTPVEMFAYAVYWIVIIILGVIIVRRINKKMEERFGQPGEQARDLTVSDTGKPEAVVVVVVAALPESNIGKTQMW